MGNQQEAVKELDLLVAVVGPEETGLRHPGDRQPDHTAGQRADDPRQGDVPGASLERHDQRAKDDGECDVGGKTECQRLKNRGGVRDDSDDECPRQNEPGHAPPRK